MRTTTRKVPRATARRFGIRRAPRRAASPFSTSPTTSSVVAPPSCPMDVTSWSAALPTTLSPATTAPRSSIRQRDASSSPRAWWMAAGTRLPPTLGDGRIMAFSGLKLAVERTTTVEIYGIGSAGAGWSSPSFPAPFVPPLYPRMALLPNGKVFHTGHGSGRSNANGWMFDPSAQTWTSSVPTTRNRSYGSVRDPASPPAGVHAEGHGPRWRQSGNQLDGDHRPLRGLPGLDARPEHVHGTNPAECGHPARRHSPRDGRIGEQRGSRTGPEKRPTSTIPSPTPSAPPVPPPIRGSITPTRCSFRMRES